MWISVITCSARCSETGLGPGAAGSHFAGQDSERRASERSGRSLSTGNSQILPPKPTASRLASTTAPPTPSLHPLLPPLRGHVRCWRPDAWDIAQEQLTFVSSAVACDPRPPKSRLCDTSRSTTYNHIIILGKTDTSFEDILHSAGGLLPSFDRQEGRGRAVIFLRRFDTVFPVHR